MTERRIRYIIEVDDRGRATLKRDRGDNREEPAKCDDDLEKRKPNDRGDP